VVTDEIERGNAVVIAKREPPRCWASAVRGGIARCLKNSDDGAAEVLRGGAGSGKWVRVFVLIPYLVLIRTLCRHALAKVQACPRTVGGYNGRSPG
jgi:hypothetical protein